MPDQVVDISSVHEMFRTLEGRSADLRVPFRQIRRDVNQDLLEHFEQKRGPAGGWPDWAASTEEKFLGWRNNRPTGRRAHGWGSRANVHNRGKKRGQLTLRGAKRRGNVLGKLKSAWRFLIDKASLIAISRVPFSLAHQDGDIVGHGARLPARKHMWLSPEVVVRATRTLLDWVMRGNH